MRRLLSTQVFGTIQGIRDFHYVFAATVLFYCSLAVINPANKGIILFFLLFPLFLNIRVKNFYHSLFLTYISSSAVLTGKTYIVQLIPPGIFDLYRWPIGYIVRIVITPAHVICGLLFFFLLLRFKKKSFRSRRTPFVVHVFFIVGFWYILSDLFGSSQPLLSATASVLYWVHLVYLLLYFVLSDQSRALYLALSVLTALLLFESSLACIQYIQKSPVGLNIEAQHGIEYFGGAVDELEHTFRPLGTFTHANELGLFLSVTIPFVFLSYTVMKSKSMIASVILGILAMILTLSRAGWLALLISFVVYVMVYKNTLKQYFHSVSTRSILLAGVIVFVVAMRFIMPRIEKSMYSFSTHGGGLYVRYLQIENAMTLVMLNPIFGVGEVMSVPEGLKVDYSGVIHSFPSPVHNVFLLRMAEHGIPAFLSLVLAASVIGTLLLKQIKQLKNIHEPAYILAFGLMLAYINILVIGFFHPISVEYYMMLLVPFVLGIRSLALQLHEK